MCWTNITTEVKSVKVKQAVVRTYPNNYRVTMGMLDEYLEAGYTVAMVNTITMECGETILEYIVEKEIE